ncbi:hypothetical protein BDV28DRAFT_159955 [Aspergillus coremiiformis]|uniref:Fungal N-terminal domain-containing protein n=1 Tax=Aspergillus coremiiformis TaxID=138285 RepID=A0A5N6YY13_9EURO|nr:hypothetical protein BDV28DRAFT_159955 [Aspergillus coremiiformis]
MSGLEAIGIAASIIQIADLGAQLSIKLCTVCRRVKNADQSIQSLSSDVALTCNVLRHLGLVLEQDTRAKLCSQHALTTAHDVLEECKKAFGQIQDAVDDTDPATAKGIFQRTVRKVGFVLREPHLAILQSNLDRLKSTMLLMVNVIIYAGQLRSGSATSALREQRELIQTLIEERKGNDLRFQNLNNPVRSLPVSGEPSLAQIAASPYMGFHYMPGKPMPESDDIPSDELGKYYRLIKTILSAIDTCKPEIERARYVRIRTGVLNIHSSEIAQLEVTHGREVAEFFSRRADELVTEYVFLTIIFNTVRRIY